MVYQEYNLAYFEDNKLVFNTDTLNMLKGIDRPVKVLSVVGEARQGKSTLLNMILSYLAHTDVDAFPTSRDGDHCTNGINVVVYEDYVFMDCQGINYCDSSNDVSLLLFPYLVSDLIIYNCNGINNSVLKSLEPMVCFCNYIDLDTVKKSKLLFRVKDYYLTDDILSILNKMLESHDDQFERIRKTIKELFSTVYATHTSILSMDDVIDLDNSKYLQVMDKSQTKTNFISAITDILLILDSAASSEVKDWLSIGQLINNNTKIDNMKLDTYTTILWNDILEFINGLPVELLHGLPVDGLKSTYDTVYVKRITMYDDVCKDYNRLFHRVEKSLYDKGLSIIGVRQGKILQEHIKLFEDKAKQLILAQFYSLFAHYHYHLCSYFNPVTYSDKNSEYLDNAVNGIKAAFAGRCDKYHTDTFNKVNYEIEQYFAKLISTCGNYYAYLNTRFTEFETVVMNKINKYCVFDKISMKYIDPRVPFEQQPFHAYFKNYFSNFYDRLSCSPIDSYTINKDFNDTNAFLKTDPFDIKLIKNIDVNKKEYYIDKINEITLGWKELYEQNLSHYIKHALYTFSDDSKINKVLTTNKSIKLYEILMPPTVLCDSICSLIFLEVNRIFRKEKDKNNTRYIFLEDDFYLLIQNVFTVVDSRYTVDKIIEIFGAKSINNDNFHLISFVHNPSFKIKIGFVGCKSDEVAKIKEIMFRRFILNKILAYHEEKMHKEFKDIYSF